MIAINPVKKFNQNESKEYEKKLNTKHHPIHAFKIMYIYLPS